MTDILHLSFDAPSHTYRHGSRILPGVTTILRTMLYYPDYRNLEPRYRQLGKAVHDACHLYDLGLEPGAPYQEAVLARVQRFAQFEADTGFRGKVWEIPLADTQRGYAGTIDTIGVLPSGEIWLVDIKTGTVPVLGVSMQLAAYADLIVNGRVIPIPRPAVLPLSLEWFEQVRHSPGIKRRSLNLTAEAYTLRSHDEVRWTGDWRAAQRVFSNWKEFKLVA